MNYLTYLDECELVEEKIAYISGCTSIVGMAGTMRRARALRADCIS